MSAEPELCTDPLERAEPALRELQAGEALTLSELRTLARIEYGALRLGHLKADGDVDLVSIALPGDLVGVEYWAGVHSAMHVSAIVPTRLVALEPREIPVESVLREALLTARQRGKEMVSLRTGPVAERVRALLLLLANCGREKSSYALPSIKEAAELVGSTPETVCRVLSHLKDLHLLAKLRRGVSALDVDLLRDVRFAQGMTSSSARQRATVPPIGASLAAAD
jgi:CRP-like cAMP-binding protein